MKEAICKAFCDEIRIKEVPIGLAVSTAFRRADGDAIGFYVVANRAERRLLILRTMARRFHIWRPPEWI
jgi:hypothetical protein